MIRKLKIAGIPYKVKYFKDTAIAPDDGQECCAYIYDVTREAGFTKGQSPQALLSDMIHEALHAYYPHWSEKRIAELERYFHQFLVDNKLIDWKRLS